MSMGYNTTVVVLNDALSDIENDPEFGRKLAAAVRKVSLGKPVDVSAGGHCNAAIVLETHHADNQQLVLVGGNYGQLLPCNVRYHSETPEMDVLTTLATKMGYFLRKKPVKKK